MSAEFVIRGVYRSSNPATEAVFTANSFNRKSLIRTRAHSTRFSNEIAELSKRSYLYIYIYIYTLPERWYSSF